MSSYSSSHKCHHILNYIVSEIYTFNFKEETTLLLKKKKDKTLTKKINLLISKKQNTYVTVIHLDILDIWFLA